MMKEQLSRLHDKIQDAAMQYSNADPSEIDAIASRGKSRSPEEFAIMLIETMDRRDRDDFLEYIRDKGLVDIEDPKISKYFSSEEDLAKVGKKFVRPPFVIEKGMYAFFDGIAWGIKVAKTVKVTGKNTVIQLEDGPIRADGQDPTGEIPPSESPGKLFAIRTTSKIADLKRPDTIGVRLSKEESNKETMSIMDRVKEVFSKYDVDLEVTDVVKEEEEEDTTVVSAKLKSGEEITSDGEEFSVGSTVYAKTDEGEKMPLPKGDYEMSDGKKFAVDEEGKIVSVGEEEEEKEEAPVAEMSSEKALTKDDVKEIVVEAMKEMMSQIQANTDKLTELSAQPATESVSVPKKREFNRQEIRSVENPLERARIIQEMFN